MILRPGIARPQRGLSLVELMIAMVIAAFLSLGLVQVFSAQRVAFSANESLARIQENSRFALDYLEHDVRMTANLSCLNEFGYRGRIYNHLSVAGPELAPWLYRVDQAFEAYEYVGTAPGEDYALSDKRKTPGAGAWSPQLPPELALDAKALDGSDVIVLRYLGSESTVLTGIGVNGATGDMAVADPDFVTTDGIFAVSDCRNFSLFQALSGGALVNAGVGARNKVGWTGHENNYGPDIPLHRFHFAAYYVGMGAEGGPALFRTRLTDNGKLESEELVAGIEALQVVLGADTALRRTGDVPTQYFSAAGVQAGAAPWPASTPAERWRSVVNVRIGALIRGEQRASALPPEAPLAVADTRVTTPADSRIRHVYELQVALRNRIRG